MSAKGPVLGVLSPVVGGYYFGTLIAGVTAAARAAGGSVVVLQTLDAGVEDGGNAGLRPRSVPVGWDFIDAFVLTVSSALPHEVLAMQATGKPVVAISERFEGAPVPSVGPDNTAGIRQAVEHLIGHGHERIGFVGDGFHPDIAERHEAYEATLRAHGIEPNPAFRYRTSGGDWSVHSERGGDEAGAAMLAAGLPTTAVVCATDYNAVGVVRRLQDAGYVVPRDQAVVGFDDTEIAAHINPPLASVSQRFEVIGEYAGELALRLLRGEDVPPGDHVLPTYLVPRASCGCWQPARPDSSDDSPSTRLASALVDLVTIGRGDAGNGPLADAAIIVGWAERALTASGSTEPDAGAFAAIEGIYRLVPRPETANGIIWALERFVEGSASAARAATVGHLVAHAAIVLAGMQMGAEFQVSERFERALSTQYEINMELLNGSERGPAALGWAHPTEASIVCLALWRGAPAVSGAEPALEVAGWFDRRAAEVGAGEQVPVGTLLDIRAFPPLAVRARSELDRNEVVFVVPVRGRGEDRGLLAVSAPIETRSSNGRQTFNQWAALLGVALKHEEVLTNLQTQRAELSEAFDRERDLRESVRRSEERYAIALRAANDGLWDWDLATNQVFYSERCAELLGRGDRPLGGMPSDWLDRIDESDAPGLVRALHTLRDGGRDVIEYEHRVVDDAGGRRWLLARASIVRDGEGRGVRVVGSLSDVDERRRLEEQLRHAALYDALTGLPNRTLFLDRLSHAIMRAQRYPSHQYAVMFLDLDGFKVVNDSLGHEAGDRLLVAVADAINDSLRDSDTGARFGGDEFAILLDSVADLSHVPAIAERLQARLARPLQISGNEVVVSASIGIALSSAGYSSADDVLRDADIAMYGSKSTGRGDYTFFDTTMHDRALHRMHLETELRRALALSEFEMHYQPIVRLPRGELVGLEALVRWRHPDRGLLAPGDFLRVAEESGLIVPIGQWVIDETCRQIAEWQGERRLPPGARVSVNVSNREFWHPGLLEHISASVRRHGILHESLSLEITESVIMHNPDAARRVVSTLHEHNIDVHIDDFGIGFSSLSVLHELPLEGLKIDQSFVTRMLHSVKARELVRTMVAMGNGIGMKVIAEGVEDSHQVELLAELGCELAQGHFFARPSASPDLLRLPVQSRPGS